jgi:hypothetical protein
MDTTPPDFTGPISVTHSNGFLIATWAAGAFNDPQEAYQLDLQFAIGNVYMFYKDNIHCYQNFIFLLTLCFESCII